MIFKKRKMNQRKQGRKPRIRKKSIFQEIYLKKKFFMKWTPPNRYLTYMMAVYLCFQENEHIYHFYEIFHSLSKVISQQKKRLEPGCNTLADRKGSYVRESNHWPGDYVSHVLATAPWLLDNRQTLATSTDNIIDATKKPKLSSKIPPNEQFYLLVGWEKKEFVK